MAKLVPVTKLAAQNLAERVEAHSSRVRWASLALISAASLSVSIAHTASASDAAEEARTIYRQVLQLINESKLDEAEEQAKKGGAVCADAGSIIVFCESQFNESLGDIARRRGRHAEALAF